MDPTHITGDTNTDELLTRWPGATGVFLRRRMACPGCPLARFETVGEICAIYRQPLRTFLAELRRATSVADKPAERDPTR